MQVGFGYEIEMEFTRKWADISHRVRINLTFVIV